MLHHLLMLSGNKLLPDTEPTQSSLPVGLLELETSSDQPVLSSSAAGDNWRPRLKAHNFSARRKITERNDFTDPALLTSHEPFVLTMHIFRSGTRGEQQRIWISASHPAVAGGTRLRHVCWGPPAACSVCPIIFLNVSYTSFKAGQLTRILC